MPIKGLTDNVIARFPRVGKLRKGGEKAPNAPGPDLPYFRFTSPIPEAETAFHAAYGDQPVAITVFLPYQTADENFQTWKEKWISGGLEHRCDGVNMGIWLGDDKHYHREPKPCSGGCDEVGRLCVVIPELIAAGYVGYVTMETHSINDLLNIQAVINQIASSRGDHPLGLRGIQFTLRRAKENISVPGFTGDAKRQRVDKWLVYLEPSPDWVRVQLEMMKRLQLQDIHSAGLLPSPDEEDDETEFHQGQPTIIDGDQSKMNIPPATDQPSPPGIAKAFDFKTPRGTKLRDLQIYQLSELLGWCNGLDPKVVAKYSALKEAVEIVYDYRMANSGAPMPLTPAEVSPV